MDKWHHKGKRKQVETYKNCSTELQQKWGDSLHPNWTTRPASAQILRLVFSFAKSNVNIWLFSEISQNTNNRWLNTETTPLYYLPIVLTWGQTCVFMPPTLWIKYYMMWFIHLKIQTSALFAKFCTTLNVSWQFFSTSWWYLGWVFLPSLTTYFYLYIIIVTILFIFNPTTSDLFVHKK